MNKKQLKKFRYLFYSEKRCDCECHTQPESKNGQQEGGCDLCYEESEYYPRHPDACDKLIDLIKNYELLQKNKRNKE